ncbi:MAG: hypothetical protein NZ580_05155 [Bacteroidia bacterium]|nr:hypothetical protein [Bacteroidia bacterium]MDW8236198.1 hypothetical protein [Bacteroidia bacterium]
MRGALAFVFLMSGGLFAQSSNNFSPNPIALNDPTKQAAHPQEGEPVLKAWYFDKNGFLSSIKAFADKEAKSEELVWKWAEETLSSHPRARVVIVRKELNPEAINRDVARLTQLIAKYGRKGKIVRYYVSPDKDPDIETIMEPWSYQEKEKNPFEGWDKARW